MELVFNRKSGNKIIDISCGNIITVQTDDLNSFVEKISLERNISIVNYDIDFLGDNFLECLNYVYDSYDVVLLKELLVIFGMKYDIVNVSFDMLSFTEKVFLSIVRDLLNNSKIVFFIDIFKYLDYNSEKKVLEMLLYLKNKRYYIFVSSSDVNVLYKIGDYSLVMWKKYLDYGKCDILYTNVGELIKNGVTPPALPFITYIAKRDKNVKLFYSKDVRDIIKDIYKHV